MEEKTKKILEFLEPFGIGHYKNVSSLLNDFFPVQDTHNTNEVHSAAISAQDFFRALLDAHYIKARDTEIRGLGSGNSSGGYRWLSNMNVEVSVDSKGLEALSLERAKESGSEMERSVLTTNASIQRLNGITEKNFQLQKNLTMAALLIAGFAALTSIVTLIKQLTTTETIQVSPLQQTDSILRMTLQRLDSLNRTLLLLDSTVKTSKHDTTKD